MNSKSDLSRCNILRIREESSQQAVALYQEVEPALVKVRQCYQDEADTYLKGAIRLESKINEVRALRQEVEQRRKVLNVEKQKNTRMEQAVEAMRCTLNKKQEEVETHRRVVTARRSANEGLAEYKEAIRLFGDWAGFGIEVEQGNRLKFSFTLLDPDDPAKECSFVLGVEDGTYKAVQCSPPVAKFDTLVQQLNGDRRLDRLVKSMRRAFVDIVAAGRR